MFVELFVILLISDELSSFSAAAKSASLITFFLPDISKTHSSKSFKQSWWIEKVMWVWLELLHKKQIENKTLTFDRIVGVDRKSYWWCWIDLLLLGWACKCILVFTWIIFLRWSVGWCADLHHTFYSPSAWIITQLPTWSLTRDVLPCPRRQTFTLFLQCKQSLNQYVKNAIASNAFVYP